MTYNVSSGTLNPAVLYNLERNKTVEEPGNMRASGCGDIDMNGDSSRVYCVSNGNSMGVVTI